LKTLLQTLLQMPPPMMLPVRSRTSIEDKSPPINSTSPSSGVESSKPGYFLLPKSMGETGEASTTGFFSGAGEVNVQPNQSHI
jgi:hypothetical protein